MDLQLPQPGESLTAIVKLAGMACNINCYYCYEKRKPYPDEAWLTPATLARFLEVCGSRPLRIVLHGGEPLLIGVRRMRALLKVFAAYPGPLELTMQTNGLLLSDAWIDLFDEYFPDIDTAGSQRAPGRLPRPAHLRRDPARHRAAAPARQDDRVVCHRDGSRPGARGRDDGTDR